MVMQEKDYTLKQLQDMARSQGVAATGTKRNIINRLKKQTVSPPIQSSTEDWKAMNTEERILVLFERNPDDQFSIGQMIEGREPIGPIFKDVSPEELRSALGKLMAQGKIFYHGPSVIGERWGHISQLEEARHRGEKIHPQGYLPQSLPQTRPERGVDYYKVPPEAY